MLPMGFWQMIDARIRGGDPSAAEELANNALGPLCACLKFWFRGVRDSDCILDAVVEAIMSYLDRPERYHPLNMGLLGFLGMAAKANLLDLLAKARRRENRQRRDFLVELRRWAANKYIGDHEWQSQLRRVAEFLGALFEGPLDRELAALVIDRERSTEKFTELLGITDLPAGEQRKIVKRHKDRIEKTLRRKGKSLWKGGYSPRKARRAA
jgi:hypothetical protein